MGFIQGKLQQNTEQKIETKAEITLFEQKDKAKPTLSAKQYAHNYKES